LSAGIAEEGLIYIIEADARAHKIVPAALFLTYMGYTLMVPADIFEAPGWWILLLLLMLSLVSQAIFAAASLHNANQDGE
jgi:hypothetical protein